MAGCLAATVVGGGIAGLASAVSLAQAGWQTTVLEAAPAFGEVGAGLAITPNGMAALDALGLGEAVRTAAHRVVSAGFQDRTGRWLLRIPETPALAPTTTIWGIHRQRLHAALRQAAEAADGVTLVTGARVTSVRPGAPGGGHAGVTWRTGDDEHTSSADLVVGADGVWSTVRAQVFPDARPAYTGSTSWRAVIADAGTDDRFVEVWGPGTEFGALRVSDTETYWYGQFRHPPGSSFDDEPAAARRCFSAWAPRVRALVDATAPDQLLRHDVYHLPGGLPTYVCGRIAMVGDAAHAAQTTAGQGAASALEDGICVGRLIAAPAARGDDLASALAAFDRARRPRCRQLARQALMIARLGYEVGPGWRQSARNAFLRLVPAAIAVKAGAGVVAWTPP
ncbi:MAG TPA: FAD-dependent monooxygenase [Acidimicrobiales bacterium]|nr:FAD-dependent monooxygenase [Acidimicrobiales bacterium]